MLYSIRHEEKRPHARSKCRWEDNIKMVYREVSYSTLTCIRVDNNNNIRVDRVNAGIILWFKKYKEISRLAEKISCEEDFCSM